MTMELTDEATTRSIVSIKRYVKEALDQDMGDLKARLVLEFFLKEIGPSIYNGAIADAQRFLRERVDDLEGACAETEFGYWPPSSAARRGATGS